uniref:Uncharacterized protein n=1 Tax=Amphimedon queenslandica TaxID=400682 RepID=A0A1X7V9A6_AMPQE
MSMYALASVPLIEELDDVATVYQVWYADDASDLGSLNQLRKWWDGIATIGKHYGYFPNASKFVPLVKESYERACKVFESSGIVSFVDGFIKDTVDKWLLDLKVLCTFAESQPQAAYAALTHGLFSRWTCFLRSCDVPPDHLIALDKMICLRLIPALSGKQVIIDLERDWLALSICHGGIGLIIPSVFAETQYNASCKITRSLEDCWLVERIYRMKNSSRTLPSLPAPAAAYVRECLDTDRKRLIDVACERGASAWLSALPQADHGFDMHKGSFRDSDLPSSCVCDSTFTVDHALHCPVGGLLTLRHNELRDLTASLLEDVCSNVSHEPPLQPLSGESITESTVDGDEARADIAVDCFWGRSHQRAFFDVTVLNPFSESYKGLTLPAVYKKVENWKKRKYDARIRNVEHGCFSPLVFTTNGGLAPISDAVFRCITLITTEKQNKPFSPLINFI